MGRNTGVSLPLNYMKYNLVMRTMHSSTADENKQQRSEPCDPEDGK